MLVFLTGFMGCGKSTVGRHLADQLGYSFIDSDEQIETQTGMTVRELFEKRGEAAFRELELLFVDGLNASQNAVVSLGGGLPCYNNLMERLKTLGSVIYLETTVSTLVQRLDGERQQRPLLQRITDLEEYITNKLAERSDVYEQAHFRVETDNLSIEEITEKCAGFLV